MKFITIKKRTWLHRLDPFQALIKRYQRKPFLGMAAPKTHFDATITDQGDTEQCFEYQSCQIQNSVDGVQYSQAALLAAVCAYLDVSPAQYEGTDMNTAAAAQISPGLTPTAGGPALTADAIIWIKPEGTLDLYDTIQSYILRYQRPVFAGITWYESWEGGSQGIVPNIAGTPLGGHFTGFYGTVQSGYLGIAFGDDRMDNANTWGVNAPGSVQGHYLFSRAAINNFLIGYPVGIALFNQGRLVKILGQLSVEYTKLLDLLQK